MVVMTGTQRDIIIGTILGDSYVNRSQSGKTHIQIKQADRYKEYVFWLYHSLRDLFPVSTYLIVLSTNYPIYLAPQRLNLVQVG